MAQKRKLHNYDDDYDCDTESLSSFESDEDFVHSISSSEDDSSDEEDFSCVRQWCKINSSSPAPSRFSFTGDVGMKASVTNISDPLEYFELFFTDEIVNHIVTETNIFADENLNKFKSKEHSRSHHWRETNANELRVFFATLILQGIITKPTVRMYWSKRKLIETPSFSNLMSSRRFDLIMQFIHFDRNENTDSSHPQPKLKKIWTVLNYLQKKFSEVYTPEQDICIDESLLLYKGRLSWIQYLPLKRARFGIKTFMLCESHSGYVWSIIIYVGKGTDISEENKECSFSTQVVLALSKPLLNKGYCLTMDNYYNSPELGEILLKSKTDFFGTLRPNRKDLPKELKTEKLKKGDLLAYQRGKMMIMRWRDKKYVHFISSIHNPEIVKVPNKLKNVEIEKPKIALDYNNTMGGVDRMDQQIGYYDVTRSRQRKYYKKIFRYLLDITIFNAFQLWKKKGNKKSNLEFRIELAERIVEKYHTHRHLKSKPAETVSNTLRLSARHFPDYIPPTEKKKEPTRRCVICCNKNDDNGKRIRRETRTYCKDCNAPLCAIPCFKVYHTQKDF